MLIELHRNAATTLRQRACIQSSPKKAGAQCGERPWAPAFAGARPVSIRTEQTPKHHMLNPV
jgi:hypothetical protein